MPISLLDIALSGLALFLLSRVFKVKHPAPFPPGPKGLPIVGNVLDMPRSHEWITFSEWANKWGNTSIILSFFSTDTKAL